MVQDKKWMEKGKKYHISHPAEVSSGVRSHQRVSDPSDHGRQPRKSLLNATVEEAGTESGTLS